MKKTLLISLLLAFTTMLFSQNFDFEEWTADTTLALENYQTMTHQNPAVGENVVIKSSDFTDGAHSIRLETIEYADDTVFGFFTNGDPNEYTGGSPVIFSSIDSVIGYYKYNIQPNDTALFLCLAKSNTIPTGGNIYTITGTQATWQRFSFPVSALTVDTVILAATSSNVINEIGVTPGSWLMLDNIQYKSNTFGLEAAPNHSFENWENLITEDLDNWTTPNHYLAGHPTLPVSKTTDAYSGAYAASLLTQYIPQWNDTLGGYIVNGEWTQQGPIGGLEYSEMPEKISFYYKSNIVGVDTINASFVFKNDGSIINWYGVQLTNTQISYTLWEQDINLSQTPDTVFIALSSGENPGTQFVIDLIEFHLPVGINETHKVSQLVAFPNPAINELNFNVNNDVNISIYSVNGKLISTNKYNNILGAERVTVDISTLEKGSYIYKIEAGENIYSKPFIKK